MRSGQRDGQRRGASSSYALWVPLGVALVVGGLVQLIKFFEAGRPSTPAGAVLAVLLGAAMTVHGLRRRHAHQQAAQSSSTSESDDADTVTTPRAVATPAEVLEQVRIEVLPGFTPRAEVAERVRDYFEGYAGPTGLAEVEPLVEAVWSQRLAEESSWTEAGDYDKVQAAFEELEGRGFVARMNFTCCQTCGHAEIEDERRGGEHSYVFFHAQDTQHLTQDDTELYLAFGCFDTHPMLDLDLRRAAREPDGEVRPGVAAGWEAVEIQVGSEITDSLRRQGLAVGWDQTPARRPSVQIGKWQKPLPRPAV